MVTLIVAGFILLLLETFLPGMIAGIAGLGCLIGAVVVGYQDFGPGGGTWVLFAVTGLLGVGTCLWFRFFPHSRFARRFVSQRTIGDLNVARPELLHQTGTAFTILRPSGTALINGRRVDVVTEGGLIERGAPVKVVAIEGLRVVVRAL